MKTPAKPILAIDTGQADGSVAVLGGAFREVRHLGTQREHARLLASAIHDAFAAAGCHYRDLACIAVVRGPGSFTGLRVGVATAKAIAWASGRPLVAVSSFETAARRVRRMIAATSGPATGGPLSIPVAFDAGRGDVSATIVTVNQTPDGDSYRVGTACLTPHDAWLAGLARGSLVVCPPAFRDAAKAHGLIVPDEASLPAAAECAALAAAGRAAVEDHDDPFTLVPDYMRPSYAEESAKPTARP